MPPYATVRRTGSLRHGACALCATLVRYEVLLLTFSLVGVRSLCFMNGFFLCVSPFASNTHFAVVAIWHGCSYKLVVLRLPALVVFGASIVFVVHVYC